MLNLIEVSKRTEVAELLQYIIDKLNYKTYLIEEF
jgi:hypothetical protein